MILFHPELILSPVVRIKINFLTIHRKCIFIKHYCKKMPEIFRSGDHAAQNAVMSMLFFYMNFFADTLYLQYVYIILFAITFIVP